MMPSPLSLLISFYFQQETLSRVTLALAEGKMRCQFFGGSTQTQKEVFEWMEGYLAGLPSSCCHALTLSSLPPFSKRVLEELLAIPFGKTASYLEIARRVGSPQAARAVGMACHTNPFPLMIPCHRVIRTDGSMGGFAVDLEIKRRLLSFEGLPGSSLGGRLG